MSIAFSRRLRELRTEQNMTQKEMSTLLGLKDSRSIRAYETDQSEPSICNLIQLSERFDVSIDYLVGATDDPTHHRPPRKP